MDNLSEAVTKTVAGKQYPSSAFLVVEDSEAVSTWHLRYRDAAGNVDHAECMAHWALGCEYNTATEEPVVGVAHAKVTANYWFWLQTWGPCWLGPTSAGPCEAAHKHQIVFESTGEIENHNYDDASFTHQQHAGFGLCHAVGGGQGAPFMMLQICP